MSLFGDLRRLVLRTGVPEFLKVMFFRFPTFCSSHRSPRSPGIAFLLDFRRLVLRTGVPEFLKVQFLRSPTFCSANRAPRLSDSACFEIVDVIFLEQSDYWKKSATGSAAAPDKWFLQKKVGFLEKSAPGSAAAPDKSLVQKK